MSALWVYVAALASTGSTHVLSPEESRHVTARRLREGDSLVAFDGRGGLADARIEQLGRRSCRITLLGVRRVDRTRDSLRLATAIPKGDRLSTLLQMTTQLGVDVWQPLVLEESVVRTLDPTAPRLERILLESCKVARRAWRLEIRPPASLESVLERAAEVGVGIVYGERTGAAGALPPRTRLVVIGPEAGFREAEIRALARSSARPVSLSPHNLRIETAAVAAAVALQALRADEGERVAHG